MDWASFIRTELAVGATLTRGPDPVTIACFGDVRGEYDALGSGPGLADRSYRGLLEITGRDRAAWLHNLTTQEVRNLQAGEGAYAFALNVQGRILFDLNILVMPEAILIDLDRPFLATAGGHLDKYVLTEDVHIHDRTEGYVRLGLAGDRAKTLCMDFGVPHAAAMAWLSTGVATIEGVSIHCFRHDFCGVFGVELLVPADRAVDIWKALSDSCRASGGGPIGYDAVDVRRIEAGLPWPVQEITDEVLPAETGQLDRAVSFTKGCYLGQEVVERMRSRGVVARRLVGLRIAGDAVPPCGAEVRLDDGGRVGALTSARHSFREKGVIGLGYVKTASAVAGTRLHVAWGEAAADAEVAALPFVGV
ncbi:MAG: glycine cleavage T C-terminal barrel domain-containing protein [Phycisphaerae bacterium]|jgi:aminomethyltransferase